MKPLEAMARALCALAYKRGTAFVTTPGMSCEQYVDTRWINFLDEAHAAWSAAQPKVEEMVRRAVYQGWCNSDQAFGHGEWVEAIVSRVMEGQ